MKIISSACMESNLMARLSSECAAGTPHCTHFWVQIFNQLTVSQRKHLKILKLSSLFTCHFSLVPLIQFYGSYVLELQDAAEERQSLCGQTLLQTISFFHKVRENSLIPPVGLVCIDIRIVSCDNTSLSSNI